MSVAGKTTAAQVRFAGMRGQSVIVVAAVVASLATPRVAAAKDPDPASKQPSGPPIRAGLEVDTTALEDGGVELGERLDAEGSALLRREEVLPRKSLDDGQIVVKVREAESKGGGYHFDVYAKRGDDKLEETEVSRECVGCLESDVVEQVSEAIEQCLPALRATQPSVEPPPPEATESDPPPVVVDTSSDRVGLGPMGKAGVGLLVAGGAAAIVGVVFAVRGRAFETDPGAATQSGRDFRPPGYGLIGGGVAAIVTGAVLVGVDRKRRRTRASAMMLPGGGGVVWGGRF